MKHPFVMIATLAAFLAGAVQVQAELYTGQPLGEVPPGLSMGADPIGTFTYNDGTNIASAVIDFTVLGPAEVLATSGTLIVTAGSAIGSYPLLSGGPATFLSPDGAFLVNDVLYAGSDPVLDSWGLLFGSGSTEINIWGNSPGNDSFWAYNPTESYYVASTGPAAVTFSPEPSTIAIAAIGALCLVGFGIRRRPAA